MSREYLQAIATTILERDEENPGFWADLLAEVARLQTHRRLHRQTETSGAEEVAVPEEPEAADEATSEPEADAPHDVGVEGPMGPPSTSEEEASGVAPTPPPHVDLESESRAQPRSVDPTRRLPRPFPGEIMGPTSEGCWRCGGPDHFRRECPRRDDHGAVQLCFRCGRLGTTVRNCPKCKEGWLAQGPYVRGRGHIGPDPPRRRGLPPPMRRRENMQPPAWLG
ncbi:gag protein [Lasius niger]|uniref:Gag protein n=1 Tax=Lasius niger TaxID=67767 RepID=A0A0J7K1H6_LASNI|nr:gag protein [Lasius niger]